MHEFLKRLWYFIWKDDSLLSWIVNVILAFILVKYLIYPSLGLLLGTSFPVVAVVSGSMEHPAPFEEWWSRHAAFYTSLGISQAGFSKYPFVNGFNKGDIMVILGREAETIKKGDVVVYRSSPGFPPIIHRVIAIERTDGSLAFITKGDNNPVADRPEVGADRLIGTAIFRVPYLGWVKIWFTQLISLIM